MSRIVSSMSPSGSALWPVRWGATWRPCSRANPTIATTSCSSSGTATSVGSCVNARLNARVASSQPAPPGSITAPRMRRWRSRATVGVSRAVICVVSSESVCTCNDPDDDGAARARRSPAPHLGPVRATTLLRRTYAGAVPKRAFRLTTDSPEIEAAFAELRRQLKVSLDFPDEVLADAEQAARSPRLPEADETAIPFVTLDPLGSRDLDQAFHFERRGDGLPRPLRDRGRRGVRRPRRPDGRRGPRARRDALRPGRERTPLPARALGGRREPAARRDAARRRLDDGRRRDGRGRRRHGRGARSSAAGRSSTT